MSIGRKLSAGIPNYSLKWILKRLVGHLRGSSTFCSLILRISDSISLRNICTLVISENKKIHKLISKKGLAAIKKYMEI